MSATGENGLKGLNSASLPLLVAVVPRTKCNYFFSGTSDNRARWKVPI